MEQKCSNLRPTLLTTFPQGFRISKKIWTSYFGKWGKKMFKPYLNCEHTDTHTDRRTHRRTFRLLESIGPKGRCFEKAKKLNKLKLKKIPTNPKLKKIISSMVLQWYKLYDTLLSYFESKLICLCPEIVYECLFLGRQTA